MTAGRPRRAQASSSATGSRPKSTHPDLPTEKANRLPIPTLLMHSDGEQLSDVLHGTGAWASP